MIINPNPNQLHYEQSIKELKTLYKQGVNITGYLRDKLGVGNTPEIIEIAYDLQSGDYTAQMENDPAEQEVRRNIARELVRNMLQLLPNPQSIMEAGIGEGTQLSEVLSCLGKPLRSFGFDISWSRIAHARNWLQKNGLRDVILCTGDLFHIPYADNSFDIVYTCHAVEPNGGNEEAILQELFRVTRKYLLLLEPGYEFVDDKARERMDRMGYIKNLRGAAGTLGLSILDYKPFPYRFNELNPNALMVIEKQDGQEWPGYILADPQFKTALKKVEQSFFSPEALRVYPILGDIPCLRIENGIIASQFLEFMIT